MVPARFRVRRYTAIAWDGTLPGGDMPETVHAARVRDGQVTETLSLNLKEETSHKLKQLKKFAGIDMLLLYRGTSALLEVNQYCFHRGIPIFANTVLSLEELLEEAVESKVGTGNRNDIIASAQKLDRARGTEDEAALMSETYQLAAGYMFDYENPYPVWLKYLDPAEERYMSKELTGKEKNLRTAYLLLFVGLHYWYLGRPWKSVLYILTLGGCFLWFLFDAYRMPFLVDMYHAEMANNCYNKELSRKKEENSLQKKENKEER